MKRVVLGAPSLSGKDANDIVKKAFGKYTEWPISLLFTNNTARALSFPEVNGLYLAPCTDKDACKKVVSIKSMDALQRLASSIEQVSELNKIESLVFIDEPLSIEEAAAIEAKKAEEAAAEAKAIAEAEAKAKKAEEAAAKKAKAAENK